MVTGPGFRLDFTFLLFVWAGGGLIRGKEGFRKGVGFFLGLYAVLAFVGLLLTAAVPGFSESVLSATPDLAGLQLALLLVTTAPPFLLLRATPTRIAYRSGRGADFPEPPGTPLRKIYYLLAPCVLAGIPAWIDLTADRAVFGASTTFSTSISSGMPRVSVTVHRETQKNSTPLYLAAWILGDQAQASGRSGDGSTVYVGDAAVKIPGIPSIRFLLRPPAEPLQQANILLVDADGRVTRVDRRVTVATLARAEQAVRGVTEFAEIRERLERALPPLKP